MKLILASISALLGLALAGSVVGCGCDTSATSSVTVDVVDTTGAAVEGATVTYSVDDGVPNPCELMAGSSFVCGWEESGDFTITVKHGAETKTATVTVDDGSCHVDGEVIKVTIGS